MTSIILRDVSLHLPIYEVAARSLKKHVVRSLVGGAVSSSAGQVTVVTALDGVSLEFRSGDRVGLVGHNGAGKSTLLRLLAGIYEPTAGELVINGRVTPLLENSLGLDHEATGYENIVLRGIYLGRTRREIAAHIDEIAAFTELGTFLDMPTRTYSAGMLSRLVFAVSTHFDTDILLIDEGISAGDAAFQEKASARLESLIGRVGILLVASHSEAFLSQYCDSRLLMERGRIQRLATPGSAG